MNRFFSLCMIVFGTAAIPHITAMASSGLSSEQAEVVAKTAEAVLQLPDKPHERNRNRELGHLVELMVSMNELDRAEEYQKRITNWRAEQLKAKIALAYHQRGDQKQAEVLISEVATIAETIIGWKAGTIAATGKHKNYFDRFEDFRLDRIKVALTEYFWATGDKEAAAKWSENVLPSEKSEFVRKQAEALARKDYEASLAINLRLIKGDTFEGKKAAIDGLTLLYGIHFGDKKKRDDLEELIDEYSISMPVMYRIEWLHSMSVSAFEHGDKALATKHYAEASLLISQGSFRPRMFFPLKAENIITGYRLEHTQEALESAELLYQEYEKVESKIYDIYRADVLCVIAEAFAFMGEKERAAKVYMNALDQAVINPNSRPRIEDLNVIVGSMIGFNVPLTKGLMGKIDVLIKSLGEPW
jgi:hypothetical protein